MTDHDEFDRIRQITQPLHPEPWEEPITTDATDPQTPWWAFPLGVFIAAALIAGFTALMLIGAQ